MPANITTLKVLHSAKKETHRLKVANCATCQHISDLCQVRSARAATDLKRDRARAAARVKQLNEQEQHI